MLEHPVRRYASIALKKRNTTTDSSLTARQFRIFVVCCFVSSLKHWGHLLEKGWPLGSLVCDFFFCFCHFPMLCPGSGVELD